MKVLWLVPDNYGGGVYSVAEIISSLEFADDISIRLGVFLKFDEKARERPPNLLDFSADLSDKNMYSHFPRLHNKSVSRKHI